MIEMRGRDEWYEIWGRVGLLDSDRLLICPF